MKKYLLFIISMLCVSIGTWATVTYEGDKTPDGAYAAECGRFTTETAGDLNNDKSNLLTKMVWYKTIFIVGPVNEDDIKAMNDYGGSNDIIIDFTFATGLNAGWLANITNAKITGLGLPDEFDLALTNPNLKVVYSTAATGAKQYGGDSKGGESFKVNVLASGGLTQIRENHLQKTYYQKFRTFDVYGSANYTAEEMTAFRALENIGAVTEIATYGGGDDPYIVSGCNVIIQMDKVASGQTLADQIALAKAQVGASICTLTVTGEINDNDLIALGGTNMTGATRIDLSGATLASGVNLDYLQIPSSLESLVLPKDQTFSVGLKSKLTAATNLKYAYTPSSDCTATGPNQADENNQSTYKYDDSQNTIADYVWVNKAGGLAEALENEEQLRNSFYIKVASGVALTATDINFGALTNKPTNYLFLDLSESIMTPTVADSYTVDDDIPYRIILPNNWSNADLAHFQANEHKGNLAAVYSYEDTKLNILVINDDYYWGTALQNPRIVRAGTNAIDILPGADNAINPFGTATTEGKGIITAINNANASIKSVYISIANRGDNNNDDYSFSNPNITYLNFDGLKSAYGTGPNVNVSGCTKLQTLDVKNADIVSLDAHNISSLTSVNLTGTKITGETNLSGTGLRTFTTNSSTNFGGALNLASTAITSFETQAKVTGDISLNACSSLTSLDISGTQFQNTTSKIHVHATDDEDDTDVLSGLNTAGQLTIHIPAPVNNTPFDKTRIHPNDDNTNSSILDDNIATTATSGDGSKDGDQCYIEYDADTKTATAHINTAGHLADLLYSSYASYPEGTTFKFAAGSQINENDLEALAGYIKKTDNTEADYAWRSNYYYVDLYDLTASAALCDNTTGVIGKTINWLRTNDRQFKGLILPKDHTLYGSGISLIQSEHANTASELSTCSEFIAYFKTKEIKQGASEASDLTKTILFTHVYNQTATNSEGIQASNDKLTELLTAHGLNGAGASAADLYSVSTNGTTPFNATALVGNKGYIETFNNEMVGAPTKANIYAYPKAAGEYTTFVGSSSIGVTPTEVLKIAGTVSNDASAVATAFNTFTNGPRVLDLSEINPNDDTFLKGVLEELTNNKIEYIILPAGKSKELVCNTTYSASMTKLKAVISTDGTDLVAYVKQAGSLAEARYLATGGSVTGNIFTPTITGLQSVTLTGKLNAADIAANTATKKVDTSGHWGSGSGNASSIALSGEQGTITTIDLKGAEFDEQTDMNFSLAGLGSIRNITLPTSKNMTLIPADCFKGITSFDDLCIPYNYTKIDNSALYGTYCSHITTTDAKGALVDNGPKTYTFSKNLEEIGTKPDNVDANGVHSLTETVFPQNRGVTDVYVLAHQVPKCYANAFPANMLYGWGGFKGGDFPYCREKYDNSSDGSMIFTVLHFPDAASFAASNDPQKESSYDVMKRKYTDVTKIYTKKEQTGAVDANGDPVAWPTFSELRRAYNQGTCGIIWDDWKGHYDTNHEVEEGFDIPTAKNAYTAATGTNSSDEAANHAADKQIHVTDVGYNFTDYEGWHQFSLAMASYVESDEQNAVDREYVQGGYYTFCIPFDMTEEQVYEMLGVPYSTNRYTNKVGSDVIKKAGDATGSDRLLPEIYTLKSVKRTPNATKNIIALSMTENLATAGTYTYLLINNSGIQPAYSYPECGTNAAGEKIVIKGGYPYYIRPYILKGETIKNLGKYVLTRYADKFKQAASCANHDETMEYLGAANTSLATLKFAKPYEEHKIWAALNDDDDSTDPYAMHYDGKRYYYTFVGQFWDQKLPRYCYYTMEGTGNWYRLSADKNYTWNAYKCVILSTVEDANDTHDGSGKYRDDSQSNYPSIEEGSTDKLDGDLKIGFQNGIDDYDFQNSAREYVFLFNDDIVEVGEGSETTAIEVLDGERVAPLKGKVYNMSGQHVGDSVEGLPKGLYIINGKKYVVK